jgi:hypothetical protein
MQANSIACAKYNLVHLEYSRRSFSSACLFGGMKDSTSGMREQRERNHKEIVTTGQEAPATTS